MIHDPRAMIALADAELSFWIEKYGEIDRVEVSKWGHPVFFVPRTGRKNKVRRFAETSRIPLYRKRVLN